MNTTVEVKRMRITNKSANAMLVVTREKPKKAGRIDYQYMVITRDNSESHHLLPSWWENHPTWKFFLRSNLTHPDLGTYLGKPRWVGNGGKTLADAKRALAKSIRDIFGVAGTHGTESPVPIDHFRE